jgi:hypothetical protein
MSYFRLQVRPRLTPFILLHQAHMAPFFADDTLMKFEKKKRKITYNTLISTKKKKNRERTMPSKHNMTKVLNYVPIGKCASWHSVICKRVLIYTVNLACITFSTCADTSRGPVNTITCEN